MQPFRWNLKKRKQLGRLIKGERSWTYEEFAGDLRECAAKVIAFSGDADLFFVGRSPESIFDYLSGALDGSSWEDKIFILNISNRWREPDNLRDAYPKAIPALKEYFREIKLDPEYIVRAKNPTCFVDLVYEGGTFGGITAFLFEWAREAKATAG